MKALGMEKPNIQVINNQPLSSKEPSSENSAEKNPNLEVVRQAKTDKKFIMNHPSLYAYCP